MKRSMTVKFIAVLLATLSLLGAVASAGGIALLTGMDLYNNTVDQVMQNQIQGKGADFSWLQAMRYASVNLGGCSEDLFHAIYGYWWFPSFFRSGEQHGYAILDSQGTILESVNPDLKQTGQTYTFPVVGEYLQVVSAKPVEIDPEETEETFPSSDSPLNGNDGVFDLVPASGNIEIYAMTIGYADGSSEGYGSVIPLGILTRDEDHRVLFVSQDTMPVEADRGDVTYINLRDAEGLVIYEAADPVSVGYFYQTQGTRYFSAGRPRTVAIPVETMPPETHPETLPLETTIETWTAEDTVSETVVSGEDTPSETIVPAAETVTATETVETAPPATLAPTEETVAAAEMARSAEVIQGRPLSEYDTQSTIYYDSDTGMEMEAQYIYLPMPDYTVELYTSGTSSTYEAAYRLLRLVRNFRNDLFLILAACLLLFAVFAVYLCAAAGHRPKSDEIRPGGLNCLPMDLYLVLTAGVIAFAVMFFLHGLDDLLQKSLQTSCVVSAGMGFLCCLTFVGFLFAFAAQVKTPGGYFWKNTLCGRILIFCFRAARWLFRWLRDKFFPWLGRFLKAFWKYSTKAVLAVYLFAEGLVKVIYRTIVNLVRKFIGFLGRITRRFLALLPLTWQWMVAGFLLLFLAVIASSTSNVTLMLLCMGLDLAIVFYVSHCFGTLLESAKRMSKGDLSSKVDDKRLAGCFQEFAEDLNGLADVAVVAAQKQLKSERMKTELITNVSHDIKTPLTSIINYVDLLQKPHTEEEGEMYLEVLQRQSQRLKKLIEDLMDMSKASTGNMAVDLIQLDAVECVNQALGEFGDKLEKAQLIPVFRHSEDSAPIIGDGRLVWRVLSNLLGNAVKYAMPGTRLYIDLMKLEGQVVISLKNISRDELNVDAEELMERFVRGDDSRNTEGSGLGLNIAKSLMELQKGQLQLLVDGDLFKVTLIFPGA